MRKKNWCWLIVLPVLLSSCATEPPAPRAFRNFDDSALIIESFDDRKTHDKASADKNDRTIIQVLDVARKLPRHRTALVIMENYSEPQLGPQFRDRATVWFAGLREVGYQHIVFLKGSGVGDPDGLPVLAEYF